MKELGRFTGKNERNYRAGYYSTLLTITTYLEIKHIMVYYFLYMIKYNRLKPWRLFMPISFILNHKLDEITTLHTSKYVTFSLYYYPNDFKKKFLNLKAFLHVETS